MAARLGEMLNRAATFVTFLILGTIACAAIFGNSGGNALFLGTVAFATIIIWLIGLACRYVLTGGKRTTSPPN
jgi:hypothetical protein